MPSVIHAKVKMEPLNLVDAYQLVLSPEFGAVSLFVGVVRAESDGDAVVSIEYDVAVTLAEEKFRGFCREAAEKFGEGHFFIEHFKGIVKVSEPSVVLAVGMAHRRQAQGACEYLLHAVKFRSPIWKKESFSSGRAHWVQGKPMTD